MQADTSCAVRFSGHRDEDEPGDHSFVSMSVMTSVKQYDTPNNVSIKHFMIHVRRPCFCTCIAKIRALAVHAQETALKRPVASTDPSTLFPLSLPCHQAVSPTTSPPAHICHFIKEAPQTTYTTSFMFHTIGARGVTVGITLGGPRKVDTMDKIGHISIQVEALRAGTAS
jgi:hypothetical protein